MFVRQPQFRNSNADVQIFYGDANTNNNFRGRKTWNKPPGVSHVYMLLIGGGGNGDGTVGGGSGAVTVWYGAAQNVPDCLEILVTTVGGGIDTYVSYRSTSATVVDLLRANTGTTSGGTATTANAFAASGFYQSIAGQTGAVGATPASSTTFLSGGAASEATANYGYVNPITYTGFFMMQPVIVGTGGSNDRNGGLGCGGGLYSGLGGQGMVLIASW